MIHGNVFQSKARDYPRRPRPASAVPVWVYRLPVYVRPNESGSIVQRRIVAPNPRLPTETGKKTPPLGALPVDHCQD